MENKDVKLEPIVPQEHYVCMTCGSVAVSMTGNKVLCGECVNDFLARNVGLMRPVREVQAEQKAAQLAQDAKGRKKKAPRKKAAVKKGGTG